MMTNDERRSRIGASMAPAVLGVSPYKDGTPLGAYLYFTGESDGPEETAEMIWGLRMEDSIRKAAEVHFQQTIQVPYPKLHVEHKFMGASPDGYFLNRTTSASWYGLEIKNVTDPARASEWGEPGTDQVPLYVGVQVQQQAAVFGFEAVEVAVSLFGRPPVYYHVPRDEEVIARIVEVEAYFWHMHVLERVPPAPDWTHPDTPGLVERLRRPEKGKIIELGDEEYQTALAFCFMGEMQREWKAGRDMQKGRLIEALGDAEIGLLPDGRRVRRRLVPAAEPKMSKGRKEYYVLEILKGEYNGQRDEDDGGELDGAAE